MKGSEAVAILQQRFGGMSGQEARVLLEMKLAQTELEHAEPKPEILFKAVSDIEVNSGGYFDVPSDFLREYEENDHSDERTSSLWCRSLDGASWAPLERNRYNLLNQRFGGQRGKPKYYDLLGNRTFLFPIPADGDTYTLSAFWYVSQPPVQEDTENAWLKHYPDLLIARTGVKMTLFTAEDPKTWGLLLQDAQGRFEKDNMARKEANMTTVFGGIR